MRDVIATVFNCSINGLLADAGTDFWDFCFGLLDEHGGPDRDEPTLDFLRAAHAHVMGRTAYEGMSVALPAAPDHPWSDLMNGVPKVVFSRTLTTADWPNTTIATGDTTEEIDRLRQGGEGHIIVWGGVRLWRSLMRLDLIDEFRIGMYPYIASRGTLLFDDVPDAYRLRLVSSTADAQGVLALRYRRRR